MSCVFEVLVYNSRVQQCHQIGWRAALGRTLASCWTLNFFRRAGRQAEPDSLKGEAIDVARRRIGETRLTFRPKRARDYTSKLTDCRRYNAIYAAP